MTFSLNPRCIAVNGVGFGARAMSVMGFKWFSIDVEPPQPGFTTGGGVVVPYRPGKITFTFMKSGKVYIKEYEIDEREFALVNFIIKYVSNPIKFVFSAFASKKAETTANIKLHSVKPSLLNIAAKELSSIIKIRRKK